jgi:CRISPR-associated protein Cmr5
MSEAAGAARTRRQTIEQQRAAYALERVRRIAATDKRQAGDYHREIMGLPAMVLVNGLGQTLAFLRAKKRDRVYRDLAGGVCERLGLDGDLLEEVTKMDMATYRLAQLEALALLGWLKRFAEAELS